MESKVNNRIKNIFNKKDHILSVYFTAGYPNLDDTQNTIKLLQKYGADMIEIGIPFSDSLMDGEVIQNANITSLENGMTIELLFQQIENIRDEVQIPLVLMGSMNPIYQFGFEKFCMMCSKAGIDGTIIPEMPLKEFDKNYKSIYSKYNLSNIFMITPQTTTERIRLIDENSDGFIYMISSNSTTGNKKAIEDSEGYFERIQKMNLNNPSLIGFNINGKKDFDFALQYSNGAIIGTAFMKEISKGVDAKTIESFMGKFK